MSKHSKKKISKQQQEKIALAQTKNDFFRKMKQMFAMIGCDGIWDIIRERDKELMYDTRYRSVQVFADEDSVLKSKDIKLLKMALVRYLKQTQVVISKDGIMTDVYTLMTAGLSAKQFCQVLIDHMMVDNKEFKEKLAIFKDYTEHIRVILDKIFDMTEYLCYVLSDLKKRIYWTTNTSNLDEERHRVSLSVTIHSVIPERVVVMMNGERHHAIRIGCSSNSQKPVWISLNPENFGLRNLGEAFYLEVFVQEHALNRLIERNDCIYPPILLVMLCQSVYDCKVVKDDASGKFFIDFCLFEVKVGYLLAEIVETKIIIRTFLFITNDGTPEGRKLAAQTGIQKDDKIYLKLDKLSTFLSPEVRDNEKIKKLFTNAGCEQLFSLKTKLAERKIHIKKHPNATLIEQYLGLNEEKTEDDSEDS